MDVLKYILCRVQEEFEEFEESDCAKTNFASRDDADDSGFHSIGSISNDTLTLAYNDF